MFYINGYICLLYIYSIHLYRHKTHKYIHLEIACMTPNVYIIKGNVYRDIMKFSI